MPLVHDSVRLKGPYVTCYKRALHNMLQKGLTRHVTKGPYMTCYKSTQPNLHYIALFLWLFLVDTHKHTISLILAHSCWHTQTHNISNPHLLHPPSPTSPLPKIITSEEFSFQCLWEGESRTEQGEIKTGGFKRSLELSERTAVPDPCEEESFQTMDRKQRITGDQSPQVSILHQTGDNGQW